MTVSDCDAGSFHGKQGGQTDILKGCIYEESLTFSLWKHNTQL